MDLRPQSILLLFSTYADLKGREIHALQERFGPQEQVDWKVIPADPKSAHELLALCTTHNPVAVVLKHTDRLPFERPPGIALMQFSYAPEENRKGTLIDCPYKVPPRRAA